MPNRTPAPSCALVARAPSLTGCGEDGVADGHVKDPGALWRPGQELGQRDPGAQSGHQNDREQYGHGFACFLAMPSVLAAE
jgi:hypothetical protein